MLNIAAVVFLRLQELIDRRKRKMQEFEGYRQKKSMEFAQQKQQRLELRNGEL